MHKTFISYHHDNEQDLKDLIIESHGGESFIDKSVSDGDIKTHISDDHIMRTIREDYLNDATVIVVLIGKQTAQRPFINSEIQAALWGDNPAGLIGVYRDDLFPTIFTSATCTDASCNCGVGLNVISTGYEQYVPYLIKKNHAINKVVAHYDQSEVYASLVSFTNFNSDPKKYIDDAFDKRSAGLPIVKRNKDDVPAIRYSKSLFF